VRLTGCALAFVLGLSWPAAALAHVERFAVIIGNNQGASSDTALLYAESDAARVQDVLRDLGGFTPANMVLLRSEDVDTVRATLIAINERVRDAMSMPDTQVVLFVYYSGHADSERLHLGPTGFPIAELAQLVRGSAASFRLVVLDACRSGALTRIKGGRVVAPFALPEEQLPGNGMAYLTASSDSEDAQESDELRGSFFTHALVSGLLGAADRDGDGAVVLDEAYRYAYEATLRATSRTLAGTQHPTFRYDFRGHGELVLTRPEAYSTQRATLHFPPDMQFLLMRDRADGPVVAELSERVASRMLSVRPGAYFVRARAADVLYEGTLDAAPGTSIEVDVSGMQRIEYARLVRKGGRESRFSHGPETGLSVRTPLPNAGNACIGGFVGYGVSFAELGLRMRASGCTSGFENAMLSATTNAFDAEARVVRVWDVPWLSFDVGLGAGASLFIQHFETRGQAPTRNTLAPFLVVGAGVALDLRRGWYGGLDLAGETHFLRLQSLPQLGAHTQAAFALRTSLMFGKQF
jgi:hypothetical protein